MKIDWKLTPKTEELAVRLSKIKEAGGITFDKLAENFGYHRTYIIALKKEGDRIRKEKDES